MTMKRTNTNWSTTTAKYSADLKERLFRISAEEQEAGKCHGDGHAIQHLAIQTDGTAQPLQQHSSYVQLKLQHVRLKIEIGLQSKITQDVPGKANERCCPDLEMGIEMWTATHGEPLKQNTSFALLSSNSSALTSLNLARSVSLLK
jgi:hypothetical protein